MVSEQHQVSAKIIASSDDLEAIARESGEDVPALSGFRRQIFGEMALKLKRGEIALAMKDGRVQVIENY